MFVRTSTLFQKGFVGDLLNVPHDVRQLHFHLLPLHSPGKREHLAHHRGAAPCAGFDHGKQFQAAGIDKLHLQQIQRHDDRPQHVIQVMRDAASQRSDAFHALRPQKLLLQLFAIGDVG